jgi:hypothetical protein
MQQYGLTNAATHKHYSSNQETIYYQLDRQFISTKVLVESYL